MSAYRVQIVHEDGTLVTRFPPGGYPPGKDTLEADFIEACVAQIVAKGVGFFRTAPTVEQRIREGLGEALYQLKAQASPTGGR